MTLGSLAAILNSTFPLGLEEIITAYIVRVCGAMRGCCPCPVVFGRNHLRMHICILMIDLIIDCDFSHTSQEILKAVEYLHVHAIVHRSEAVNPKCVHVRCCISMSVHIEHHHSRGFAQHITGRSAQST
jgi:hypothetical protein